MDSNPHLQSPSQNNFSVSKKLIPLIIVGSVFFIGLLGFLTYSTLNRGEVIEQKISELEEVENLRVELETAYNEAIAELEDMRTESEEMDALIDAQKGEIQRQRGKIAGLIGNKKKLDNARSALEKMKIQIEDYLSQIEHLKMDNEVLTEANLDLTTEKEILLTENEELNEVKAIFVSEKSIWNAERETMSKKIHMASVIQVKDLKMEGLKEKSNGKLIKRKTAKSVDQIQLCFTTMTNDIVASGAEVFLVRLVNPLGITYNIQEYGSGESTNLKTGEKFLFTKSTEIEYDNAEADVCVNWSSEAPFERGVYQMEVYNKGVLVGEKSFELK